MTVNDTVHLALRNLRQAKLRTALTILGVSIGIASLCGMVSLGVGLQDQLTGQFLQSGVFDAITVTPAADLRGVMAGGPFVARGRGLAGGDGRGRGADSRPPAAPARDLNDAAVDELRALSGVRDAYPTVNVPVQVTYGNFSESFTANGVPMSVRDEGAFRTMTAGAFFAHDTDSACLLSLAAAKRINEQDPKALVGKELTLSYASSRGTAPDSGGAPASAASPGLAPEAVGAALPGLMQIQRVSITCPVVGIVEREVGTGPFAGRGGGAGLMIPLTRAKAIERENVTSVQALLRQTSGTSPRPASYQMVTVKVAEAKATLEVEDKIKTMGFSAFSLTDALEGAKRVFIILDIVLSLIGSIALAVSSLGIVNTMVMSILERTKEIGIMKAIGASDGDIRRIFLVEASVIGWIGGIAGVALGWLVGRAINIGANIYIESQGGTAATLFLLPWWLVAGALGFSILVSVVAGSYPANRAARLEPMHALRHE